MPHSLTAANASYLLTLSATGAAASVASFSAQLNQTHNFLYLALPLWFLFIAMVVLTFIGAFISLTTDYMRSRGTVKGKMTTAVLVGLTISFVVLPTLITEPSAGLMLITSFVGGLSSTILVYVAMRLLSNKELQDAVADIMVKRSIELLRNAAGIVVEHATKLLSGLAVGVVASLVILPQLNDNPVEAAALQSVRNEVSSD